MKTYQDFEAVGDDKSAFILEAIREHKASKMYRIAFDATEYAHRRNVTILRYQKLLYTLTGESVPDRFTANHKLCSNFFYRFVTQLNQYLLGNGVELDTNKEKLGKDFDTRMQDMGYNALVQGVSFGFWNLDRLQVFKLTEFVPLYDEMSGALRAGIRFWQVDYDKPLRATLYELDGYTEYVKGAKDSALKVDKEKRKYRQIVRSSVADGIEIMDGENYPGFPIIPMWASPLRQSELVGTRESIDCYDLIKSGFANDLDDASMIYWTLQNSGGMDDVDLAKFVERMHTIKAAAMEEGVTAEAHTLDVPYQSRVAYLERLEHDLYADAQVLNVVELSAGSKTATEINAAYTPMDLRTDQFEYCVRDFLSGLFAIVGITAEPSFKRNRIQNELEGTQMVLMAAQYLDDETLLNKLPWLTPEEVEQVLDRRDEADSKRLGVTVDNAAGQSVPADGEETRGPGEEDTESLQ